MQSFGDLFANNKLLAVGLVLAAIAVILAVGIALFRLVFGRRLHMSGGRTRQPRLGVVDAFDLDRQRQLVLIRRDNVEHLLMIGGPNDVLVEAAIVRAPAALAPRDKENGFSPSIGIPAPMPQQPAAALPTAPVALPTAATAPAGGPEGGSNLPIPAPLPPEPKVDSAPEAPRPTPLVESGPTSPAAAMPDTRLPAAATLPAAGPRPLPAAPPRPASNLPPRPPVTPVARPATAATPRTNFSRATPVAPPPATPSPEPRQAGRTEPAMARPPVDAQGPGEKSAPEPSRESALPGRLPATRTLPRRAEELTQSATPAASPAQPTSSDGAASPQPRPMPVEPRPAPPSTARPMPSRPAPSAPTSQQARAPLPSLGSLEEEMAKLLGRPMPPSDTSNSGS